MSFVNGPTEYLTIEQVLDALRREHPESYWTAERVTSPIQEHPDAHIHCFHKGWRVWRHALRRGPEPKPAPAVRYSCVVRWSDEDEAFVATVPELPLTSGIGDTADAAVREAHIAAGLAVEIIKLDKQPVPEPFELSRSVVAVTWKT